MALPIIVRARMLHAIALRSDFSVARKYENGHEERDGPRGLRNVRGLLIRQGNFVSTAQSMTPNAKSGALISRTKAMETFYCFPMPRAHNLLGINDSKVQADGPWAGPRTLNQW